MKKSSTNKRILTKAYEDFSRPLSLYAISKVNDTELSDDLVQTTFVKTWMYLQNRGDINLMRAFLYHTLNGLIIDEYRKHKPLSLDQLTENGFELGGDGLNRMNNIIDGKMVASFINELPEKYKDVVTKRFMKDMTLQEISTATHQSKNATATQVHRGLLKLKDIFMCSAACLATTALFS